MTEIVKKEIVTLPQVKEILESVKPDDMDQSKGGLPTMLKNFQRLSPKRHKG